MKGLLTFVLVLSVGASLVGCKERTEVLHTSDAAIPPRLDYSQLDSRVSDYNALLRQLDQDGASIDQNRVNGLIGDVKREGDLIEDAKSKGQLAMDLYRQIKTMPAFTGRYREGLLTKANSHFHPIPWADLRFLERR